MNDSEMARLFATVDNIGKEVNKTSTTVAVMNERLEKGLEDIADIKATLHQPPDALTHRMVALEEKIANKPTVGEFVNSKTFKTIITIIVAVLATYGITVPNL